MKALALAAHQEQCPSRPVRCEYCADTVRAMELERHLREICDLSPFRLLCCVCGEQVTQGEMAQHLNADTATHLIILMKENDVQRRRAAALEAQVAVLQERLAKLGEDSPKSRKASLRVAPVTLRWEIQFGEEQFCQSDTITYADMQFFFSAEISGDELWIYCCVGCSEGEPTREATIECEVRELFTRDVRERQVLRIPPRRFANDGTSFDTSIGEWVFGGYGSCLLKGANPAHPYYVACTLTQVSD